MSEGLTLSKEQAALLLPLLPAALAQSSSAALASQDATRPVTDGISQYTNTKMFMKKKKNSKSTPAQNYLLTIVREGAKAANIWNKASLMKDLTPMEARRFYDTVFTLCPQLKSSRQLLTTRLSKTLINRRQFLRRVNKIVPRQAAPVQVSITHGDDNSNQEAIPLKQQNSSLNPGDSVKIMKEAATDGSQAITIGKGIFLSMNSEDSYEVFAKVLFQSKSKGIETDVDLPQPSNRGEYNFHDLGSGDIFLWKASRLQPLKSKLKTSEATSPSTARSKSNNDTSAPEKFKTKNPKEVITTSTNTDYDDDDDIDEGLELSGYVYNTSTDKSSQEVHSEEFEENDGLLELSQYEIERAEKIKRNKRKFEEIFGKPPKDKNFVQLKRPKKFKRQDQGRHGKTVPTKLPEIGEFIAVRCEKYGEKPLIGRVTAINDPKITIDWFIGTYSGYWKEWKGRHQGKSVIFSEEIPVEDIILSSISFTKSMRLSPKTVVELKELY